MNHNWNVYFVFEMKNLIRLPKLDLITLQNYSYEEKDKQKLLRYDFSLGKIFVGSNITMEHTKILLSISFIELTPIM